VVALVLEEAAMSNDGAAISLPLILLLPLLLILMGG
jgi:hypothetical protein